MSVTLTSHCSSPPEAVSYLWKHTISIRLYEVVTESTGRVGEDCFQRSMDHSIPSVSRQKPMYSWALRRMESAEGGPQGWEAPRGQARIGGKPAYSKSGAGVGGARGEVFFHRISFQECKCVFCSWSPVCHASQLIPLDWVTCCVGLFSPERFQLLHSPPSAFVHFPSRGVFFPPVTPFPAPVVNTALI